MANKKMQVNEIIKQYMQEQGITFRELSARTGLSYQRLWCMLHKKNWDLQKGEHRIIPRYTAINKICNAIGLKIIFEPTGEKHDPNTYLQTEELKDISFQAVKRILEAVGYEIKFEKIKKSVDKKGNCMIL